MLNLVSTGASNREVAEELVVTVHTVRKHLENAYRKLGVTNRTAAALALKGPLLRFADSLIGECCRTPPAGTVRSVNLIGT